MCARAGLRCQWAEPGSGGRWGQLQGTFLPEHSTSLRGVPKPPHPLLSPSHLVLRSPLQVIGLLDVFTPDETLDDFTDL